MCDSVVLPGPSHNQSSTILDDLEFVEDGSRQPIQQRVLVVHPAVNEGVHQYLRSLLGQHPANCTDVTDVCMRARRVVVGSLMRGMADLVDVCLHTHSTVTTALPSCVRQE